MGSRRTIVIPLGSAGDVHPFVEVALALRRRDHDVSVMVNPHFAPLLARVGLPFVPVGTAEDYHALLGHPDLWHERRGVRVLADAVRRHGAETIRVLRTQGGDGAPLLVAPGAAFGARIVHEALGFPLVTLHLQPSCFVSACETAVPHARLRSINRWPAPLKRLFLAVVDRLSDRALGPGADALRAELGLPPVRRILREWWHSPQRVIGLFPDWYAAVQPDWPAQARLTGFPLPDEADAAPTPSLDAWLLEADAAGARPVVFVAGSNNRQASGFFRAGAEACHRLGRRGLLLTRFAEQVSQPASGRSPSRRVRAVRPGAPAGGGDCSSRRHRHRRPGIEGRVPAARHADRAGPAGQRSPTGTAGGGAHPAAGRLYRAECSARAGGVARIARHRARLPGCGTPVRGGRSRPADLRADRGDHVNPVCDGRHGH